MRERRHFQRAELFFIPGDNCDILPVYRFGGEFGPGTEALLLDICEGGCRLLVQRHTELTTVGYHFFVDEIPELDFPGAEAIAMPLWQERETDIHDAVGCCFMDITPTATAAIRALVRRMTSTANPIRQVHCGLTLARRASA